MQRKSSAVKSTSTAMQNYPPEKRDVSGHVEHVERAGSLASPTGMNYNVNAKYEISGHSNILISSR